MPKSPILREVYKRINYAIFVDANKALVVFQGKNIRRIWHEKQWFFSVVDVIAALTESANPRNYWNMLKVRELEQGVELSTNCVQLKLPSSDGSELVLITLHVVPLSSV